MDEDRAVSSGFVVTPETVASRTFTTSFRGFDQAEVRTFLKRVSEELAAAAEREAQLRRLLQEAQNKAAHPEVDEELLTAALGEHAARLLGSAREQAAAIRSEAEAKASRLVRDTENQISRVRAEADSLLARRVEEVDGVSANLRNAAEADARALREQAKADAEAEVQAAKAQGREMVIEARSIRERILADLARRRHIAEVQLDQLRAARERLLEAYSLVRRTLDEATKELKMAEVEARLAAEEAGRRAGPPPPPPPPPTPPATGLDVATTGEHEAVPVPSQAGFGPAATLPPTPTDAAAAQPEPTGAPRGSNTRLRTSREPSPRTETRLRPPTRPDEGRPSSGWRKLGSPDAPARPDRPEADPLRSFGRKPPAPEPPAITPRPVPPPPARSVPPSSRPPEAEAMPTPSEPLGREAGAQERPVPREDTGEKGDKGDRVEAIFARIKADRASVAAKTSRLTPPPSEPSEPGESGEPPAPGEQAEPAPVDVSESGSVPTVSTADADRPKEITDESARGRRDELLEAPESSLVRQLKRVLQDEQNEVLDQLRRQRRPTAAVVLPSAEEQIRRLRDTALPLLSDAARAGTAFAAGPESGPSDEIAATVGSALASAVVEPLRARLERQLPATEVEAGDADVSQLSEAVSAAYRQWRAQELEPLARHYAADAFARGAFAGYAEGAGLRWVVDDEGPCPDCEDNQLAGTVTKGESYPTGQAHPPAHPGCRCLLVAAVP